MINDPLVLNAFNPNGISKKQQMDMIAEATQTFKDKGNSKTFFILLENRIHPFGQGELKEQLEDTEE